MRKLELLYKTCGSGPCPSFYKSDDGRIFIQGYKTELAIKRAAGDNLPDGEDIVEVDQDFLKGLKEFL